MGQPLKGIKMKVCLSKLCSVALLDQNHSSLASAHVHMTCFGLGTLGMSALDKRSWIRNIFHF